MNAAGGLRAEDIRYYTRAEVEIAKALIEVIGLPVKRAAFHLGRTEASLKGTLTKHRAGRMKFRDERTQELCDLYREAIAARGVVSARELSKMSGQGIGATHAFLQRLGLKAPQRIEVMRGGWLS